MSEAPAVPHAAVPLAAVPHAAVPLAGLPLRAVLADRPPLLDDLASRRRSLVALCDAATGGPADPFAAVLVQADAQALYVLFRSGPFALRPSLRTYKDKVWQEGALEVYLVRPGDERTYEFQVSSLATARDLRVDDPGGPTQRFDGSWSCSGLAVAAETVSATLRAGFAVPWSGVGADPLRAGWRIGCFRVDHAPLRFAALAGVDRRPVELHDRRYLVDLELPRSLRSRTGPDHWPPVGWRLATSGGSEPCTPDPTATG